MKLRNKDMKKSLFFGMMVAGAMALSSCGGGGSRPQNVAEADSSEVKSLINRDKTIYGLCGDGSAMNTLELITDSGDTLSLSITNAVEAGQVFGGLQVGDRMAVLANDAKSEATLVINLNALLGDWVMPDPIDGSSDVGIRFKDGGIAESIDQSVIIYRTWKIVNGKLEITSIREGGAEEEESNLYDLLILASDTLAYKTIGKLRDEEETFKYSRWKEKKKVDLHGLQLEEADDEFMKM